MTVHPPPRSTFARLDGEFGRHTHGTEPKWMNSLVVSAPHDFEATPYFWHIEQVKPIVVVWRGRVPMGLGVPPSFAAR